MPTETNEFTLKFNRDQISILAQITNRLVVDKIAKWDDLETDQQLDLVEVRNKVQKQLDFPNLKF